MANFSKRIIYLTEAQRKELFLNETITVNGVTIDYDENDIYITPQEMNMTIGQITTLPSGANATASISGDPENMTLDLGIPKGDKGDKGDPGQPGTNMEIHICSITEYDAETRMPTIVNPDSSTFYLVPTEDGTSPDLFTEWVYVNNAWEMFGSASVDLSGYLTDVKINGTSIVTDGVAEIPIISGNDVYGVTKVSNYGIGLHSTNKALALQGANDNEVKSGTTYWRALIPRNTASVAFYGLAKAAGDTTQSQSSNVVGQYTEDAKSAISDMLNSAVQISGTDPTINAMSGIRYVCGEVLSLNFTPSANGICDVVFISGSTPTVLTVPSTIKWANGFDPTALEANTTYELNIMDGLGVAGAWT